MLHYSNEQTQAYINSHNADGRPPINFSQLSAKPTHTHENLEFHQDFYGTQNQMLQWHPLTRRHRFDRRDHSVSQDQPLRRGFGRSLFVTSNAKQIHHVWATRENKIVGVLWLQWILFNGDERDMPTEVKNLLIKHETYLKVLGYEIGAEDRMVQDIPSFFAKTAFYIAEEACTVNLRYGKALEAFWWRRITEWSLPLYVRECQTFVRPKWGSRAVTEVHEAWAIIVPFTAR